MSSLLALTTLFALTLFPVYGAEPHPPRNPIQDAQNQAIRPFSADEKEIVCFVFLFYNARYGYQTKDATPETAANSMTDDEYRHTASQAAKVALNPVAKGFLRAGKAGEKALKALIIATEDFAKTAGDWIDTKAKEYDERNARK
jgi:hypothetical protein